jgi:lipopolysaccharide transport system ATP-binding protein
MGHTVIELENVSKYYRLGTVGGATLSDDMRAWWAKLRGKENPLLKIGEKDYGNQEGDYIWALRNINLKVEQGEILGIIGANGAGKSTLLKILSQVTGPTSGRVKIKGRIGSLLEVGTGFHPELTGRENVYLNGAILGMRRSEIDKKFDEIVDFSGVEKYIDTPVKRYSSGMRVRLGFAVAAHLDPEILVIDEVLAVGDAAFQKKCIGKMSDVAGEGRTVLFVSHNMSSIKTLCRRVIEVNSGQISRDGLADQIVFKYLFDLSSENSEANKNTGKYIQMMIAQNHTEDRVDFVETGDPLKLRISYNTNSEKLSDITITIGLYKSDGDRVATLSTQYTLPEKVIETLVGEGNVFCNIDSAPLVPGTYRLNVAWDGYIGGKKFHDHIRNAMSLTVQNSNYLGYSRLDNNIPGSILLKHSWEL